MTFQLGPLPPVPNIAIAPSGLSQALQAAVSGYLSRPEYQLKLAQMKAQMDDATNTRYANQLKALEGLMQVTPYGQQGPLMSQYKGILAKMLGDNGMTPGGNKPVPLATGGATPVAAPAGVPAGGPAPAGGAAPAGSAPAGTTPEQWTGEGPGPNVQAFLRSQGITAQEYAAGEITRDGQTYSLSQMYGDPRLKQAEAADEKLLADRRANLTRLDSERSAIERLAASEEVSPEQITAAIARYNADAQSAGLPPMDAAEAKGYVTQALRKWTDTAVKNATAGLTAKESNYDRALGQGIDAARTAAAAYDAYAKIAIQQIAQRTGMNPADVAQQIGYVQHNVDQEFKTSKLAAELKFQADSMSIRQSQLAIARAGLDIRQQELQIRRQTAALAQQKAADVRSGKTRMDQLTNDIQMHKAKIAAIQSQMQSLKPSQADLAAAKQDPKSDAANRIAKYKQLASLLINESIAVDADNAVIDGIRKASLVPNSPANPSLFGAK